STCLGRRVVELSNPRSRRLPVALCGAMRLWFGFDLWLTLASRHAARSFLYRLWRCLGSAFVFQAEDCIRDWSVTGVQTCALPISPTMIVVQGNGPIRRRKNNRAGHKVFRRRIGILARVGLFLGDGKVAGRFDKLGELGVGEMGRASCRERVLHWGVGRCMYGVHGE